MILQEGENCWSVVDATDSGVLIDADHYYRAIYEVAPRARRFLAISGWQFDTDVPLLHGVETETADLPVRFHDFLRALLERNRELHIYILAWDFNPIYAFERELFQKWRFEWRTPDRLHFEFDETHPAGGSHHQKVVSVDGTLAYAGGMDICDHRWDDREHRLDNALRVTTDGRSYHPYHDVQAFVSGPAARALTDQFQRRWKLATGEELSLPEVDVHHQTRSTLRIGPARVGLSETWPAMPDDELPGRDHIAVKYERAIACARRLIFIENQYFTARRVYQALVQRMKADGDGRLQIVLVLPRRPSALKEQIALGIRQSKLLLSLVDIAKRTGHALGIYYSSPSDRTEDATYIHSKVLVVDDVFLSIGSANTTNRSLGLDSELDIAWEDERLEDEIREVRLSLLKEHAGCDAIDPRMDGLVEALDGLCDDPKTRLYHLPCDDYGPIEGLIPDEDVPDFALDPAASIGLELLDALEAADPSFFARGVRWLRLQTAAGTDRVG